MPRAKNQRWLTPPPKPTAGAHAASELLGVSGIALPRLAYGIGDAADALDLSRSRIYELIGDGEIVACKVGKRTIIAATELTGFLDRHRVERPCGIRAAPTPPKSPGRKAAASQ